MSPTEERSYLSLKIRTHSDPQVSTSTVKMFAVSPHKELVIRWNDDFSIYGHLEHLSNRLKQAYGLSS